MTLSLDDFKARFGKKAIDLTQPRDVYQKRLNDYKAKIDEVTASKAPEAANAKKLVADAKKLADAGKYPQACDLLFEMNATTVLDVRRRDRLLVDLKKARDESAALPVPSSEAAGHDTAAESAIAVERYDEAERLIGEIRKCVQRAIAANLKAKKDYEARAAQATQEVRRVVVWAATQPNLTAQQMQLPKKLEALANTAGKSAGSNGYEDACRKLDELYTLAKDAAVALPPQADKAWGARWALEKPTFQAALDKVGTGKFPPSITGPTATLKAKLAEADQHGTGGRYKEALAALDAAGQAFATVQQAAVAERQNARYALDMSMNLFRPSGWPPGAPQDLESRRSELADLEKQQTAAVTQRDFIGALGLWLRCSDDFVRLQALAAIENQRLVAETAKAMQASAAKTDQDKAAKEKQRKAREVAYPKLIKEADRKAIADALLEPDADLDLFRNQPGARDVLDKMVKDIGGKADTPEKKRFVQAAIRGRFAIEGGITGGEDGKGLSSKALPRIYKLLGKIPDTHSSDEDKDKRFITAIDRRKANDTSWYANKEKNIVLKAGETGSNFDQTTLHEIGHAVDLKFGFMNGHGAGTEFGGWTKVTFDEVLRVAGEDLAFYKDFGTAPWNIPRPLLESYLRACLSGKDPATLQAQYEAVNGTQPVTAADLSGHPAVAHAKAGQKAAADDTDLQRDLFYAARKLVTDAEPKRSLALAVAKEVSDGAEVDKAIKTVLDGLQYRGALPAAQSWAAMAKHPAVDFANNVHLKPGDHGLWEQGDAGAKRCAVGGRVYLESYKGDWRSYALSARGARISNYQFRHPMEWFAESYAEFFLKKLDSSHALYPWLKAQKEGASPKP